MEDEVKMDDYRCDCGNLLAKFNQTTGQFEIKCRRCKRIVPLTDVKADPGIYDRLAEVTGVEREDVKAVLMALMYSKE